MRMNLTLWILINKRDKMKYFNNNLIKIRIILLIFSNNNKLIIKRKRMNLTI
jgi:hypothetical protein